MRPVSHSDDVLQLRGGGLRFQKVEHFVSIVEPDKIPNSDAGTHLPIRAVSMSCVPVSVMNI
jgi:hypothetical protein